MPHLPAECVGLIVRRYVQNITNVKSLHPLLLLNKDFFYETLPYLYEDPFSHVDEKHLLALMALLVRCVPQESRTQLLTVVNLAAQNYQDLQQLLDVCQWTLVQMATKGDDDDDSHSSAAPSSSTCAMMEQLKSLPPPTVNYLALVRKFGHSKMAELSKNALVHKAIESLPILDSNPEIIEELNQMFSGIPTHHLRLPAFRAQLTMELVWGLTQPHLEQVQSLLLPLADVDRYLEPTVLARLRSLATVILYINERPHYLLQRRYEQFIHFIRRHTSAFPHVLRDIRWHRTPGREMFSDPPPEYIDAWSKLLPPLDCPRRIDSSNWNLMLNKWEKVDFSHCQEIIAPESPWPQAKILSKCRALQRLTSSFNSGNVFQWALEEKMELEESSADGDSGSQDDVGVVKQLVPLHMLNARCTQAAVDPVMHAILDAFHDTLVSVRMVHHEDFIAAPFRIGENWRARRLKRLELSTVSQRLDLSRRFFHQFEAIEELSISDKLYAYEPNMIELCHTDVFLPNLKSLRLKGNAALVFPATILSHTPELEILELGTVYRNGYYALTAIHPGDEEQTEVGDGVPSSSLPLGEGEEAEAEAEEGHPSLAPTTYPMLQTIFLKARGWTWDWNLPHLTKLILAGDFAMRFRFAMLATCPSLKILSLSILTEGTQERTICKADLEEAIEKARCGERQRLEQQEQQQQQQQCVVLPHLENLRMNGVWRFDSDATFEMLMTQIIGDMLEEIVLYRCKQVPLEMVVQQSRRKRSLRKVNLDQVDLVVEPKQMAQLGLKRADTSLNLGWRTLIEGAMAQSSQESVEEKCIFSFGTQRYEFATEKAAVVTPA
ncbi:hypothetical protein BGW42_006403 [Actinomortierella wolfii]|nr:hypothetical protein BGW42_006403 [Actinomortierella wolfii]